MRRSSSRGSRWSWSRLGKVEVGDNIINRRDNIVLRKMKNHINMVAENIRIGLVLNSNSNNSNTSNSNNSL